MLSASSSRPTRPLFRVLVPLVLLVLAYRAPAAAQSIRGRAQARSADPTALRQERKEHVHPQEAEAFKTELRSIYGDGLQARVPKPRGGHNVNSTEYLAIDSGVLDAVISADRGAVSAAISALDAGDVDKGLRDNILGRKQKLPKKSISAKIRFRKYLVEKSLTGSLAESSMFKGLTWVEIKMPHSEHEVVSLKTRILATDADARMLRDATVMSDPTARTALLGRIRKTNIDYKTRGGKQLGQEQLGAIEADIDDIGRTFAVLHWLKRSKGKAYRNLRPGKAKRAARDGYIATDVHIAYRRESYKADMPFTDPADGNLKTYEAQFTFDENVQYRQPNRQTQRQLLLEGGLDSNPLAWHRQAPQSFNSEPHVVEVKLPAALGMLSKTDLKSMRKLARKAGQADDASTLGRVRQVKQARRRLLTRQKSDKGKFFHFGSKHTRSRLVESPEHNAVRRLAKAGRRLLGKRPDGKTARGKTPQTKTPARLK